MFFYRKKGIYECFVKRVLDIILSLTAIIVLFIPLTIIALTVRIKMGSPIFFTQLRPGIIDEKGREKIFRMIKFRTMTDARDADGNLLPDSERLPAFGKMLRATSLDELPELLNILKGDMSFIGPRPQLVRDMVFMDEKQRMRHTARPGLSGLAQVMGRNAVTWEEKFNYDLRYIEKVTFFGDCKILFMTIKKVFGRSESSDELDVTYDYGDYLLINGKISEEEYNLKQAQAKELLHEYELKKGRT